MNLISVSALDLRGYRGTVGNGVMTIVRKDGTIVLDGVLASEGGGKGLYHVEVVDDIDLGGEVTAAIAGGSRNQPTDLETWHRRFGHCDVRTIQRVSNKSLV